MAFNGCYISPLAIPGTIQTRPGPLPPRDVNKSREIAYNVDAVKTWHYNVPRKIPIIPKYDAYTDQWSKKYFESPLVKRTVGITLTDKPIPKMDDSQNVNKLSVRHRCPPTPPPEELASREESFINDAIISEKLRTKYNRTLLPPYDVLTDPHCHHYVTRPDVRKRVNQNIVQGDRKLSPPTSPAHCETVVLQRSLSPVRSSRLPPATSGSSYYSNPLAASTRVIAQRLIHAEDCLLEREQSFVNDAIKTEKSRTRFKDIIPKYDASVDTNARGYFTNPDVQRHMSVTCSLKPVSGAALKINNRQLHFVV